jgi:Holliday junction resolvasome RuvABC endonuclease subunit
MIGIAIDPSLSNTCLTAFEFGGDLGVDLTVIDSVTISTQKNQNKKVRASSDLIERCVDLYKGSKQFIERYNPQIIFAETPSGSQSASGMKNYGVSCFLLASLSQRCIEVTPQEVKMASVGKKNASKKDMIEWAYEQHPEAPWIIRNDFPLMKQEHLADSIAVIHAGLRTKEFDWIQKCIG